MEDKDKITSIVEKLQRAEGFMLGMRVLSLLDKDSNSKIGRDLYDLKTDIAVAKEQAVDLYQKYNMPKD